MQCELSCSIINKTGLQPVSKPVKQSFRFFRKVQKKVQTFIEIFPRGAAPSPPPNPSSKPLETELVKFGLIDMLFGLILQVFGVKESIFGVKNQKLNNC